ncbi:hypothetical protein FH972_021545 [Carpinus fangiana]|uniref:Uncharacterized protein n=1 Tax=Carpinus fangiana TaxID=176857 RepID=A0A5N6KPZ8_9ROSI|nr:hypothetical protein FH972_021545 [Carpinus fangiana]
MGHGGRSNLFAGDLPLGDGRGKRVAVMDVLGGEGGRRGDGDGGRFSRGLHTPHEQWRHRWQ